MRQIRKLIYPIAVNIMAIVLIFYVSHLLDSPQSFIEKRSPSGSSNPQDFNFPFELQTNADPGTYSLVLNLKNFAFFESSEKVKFRIATWGLSQVKANARLRFLDDAKNLLPCTFDSESGVIFNDNDYLELKKSKICNFEAKSGVVILDLKASAPKLAVWSQKISMKELSDKSELYTLDSNNTYIVKPFVLGTRKVSNSTMSTLDLLSYMWSENLSSSYLKFAFYFFGFVYFLGIFLITLVCSKLSRPIGSLLVFCSLGLTLALLTPPLQAPDEPDHLLSYVRITNDIEFEKGLLDLAHRSHFERIKFNPDEKFTPIDVAKPETGGWALHISHSDVPSRSPLTASIWKIYHFFLKHISDPGIRILMFRWLNVIFATICLSFVLLLLLSDSSELGSFGLLTACFNPFFLFILMHVSDYSLVALLVVTIMIFLTGFSNAQQIEHTTFKKHVTLATILFICSYFMGKPGQGLMPFLIVILIFLILKKYLINLGKTIENSAFKSQTIRYSCVVICGVWFAACIRRLFISCPPQLPDIEFGKTVLSTQSYAFKVLKRFFAMPTGCFNDWYLSDTFWGGFGWLEALPNRYYLNTLQAFLWIGLFLLFARNVRKPEEWISFLLNLVVLLTVVVVIVVLSIKAYGHHNLHGRYLIGVYGVLLSLGAKGWSDIIFKNGGKTVEKTTSSYLFCLLLMLSTANTYIFLLKRYF